MSNGDQSKPVSKLEDLPYYKEEFTAELEKIGINDLEDLKAALADETKVKLIEEEVSGVGPKTIEHWQSAINEKKVSTAKKVAKKSESGNDEDNEEKSIVPAEGSQTEIVETEIVTSKGVEIVEKGGYKVKLKPELDQDTKDLLDLRYDISHARPRFLRQEWFRFPRLGLKWRRPRGMHSKMKHHINYRPVVVSIGYRGPKAVRGLHSSGFEEVMIFNVDQLEKLDPKQQAARVGGGVGTKKRLAIQAKADELGIRILNRTG